jgi:hypothetical protein
MLLFKHRSKHNILPLFQMETQLFLANKLIISIGLIIIPGVYLDLVLISV